eukprot:CAMPEP_0114503780 /NCGR_PEP_ID=MMETSP0109-20121206/9837_1 /TAXON_ID=29199 /ORGANISM="Chlorarachnion reptans, Strain CCCM449" /LENGTH=152 /DNA_ID=CAMNT_0001681845 /DNA_START=111 /DNA_END=565 /DNA_ORIENTATION=-
MPSSPTPSPEPTTRACSPKTPKSEAASQSPPASPEPWRDFKQDRRKRMEQSFRSVRPERMNKMVKRRRVAQRKPGEPNLVVEVISKKLVIPGRRESSTRRLESSVRSREPDSDNAKLIQKDADTTKDRFQTQTGDGKSGTTQGGPDVTQQLT